MPFPSLINRSLFPHKIHWYGSVFKNPLISAANPGFSGMLGGIMSNVSYTFGNKLSRLRLAKKT